MSTASPHHNSSELHFNTQAVHAGNQVDPSSGALRTPIVMANSYLLPEDPSEMSWSGTDTPIYTRNSGTNQQTLEAKLAIFERGEQAVVLASGVAALHATFFTFLRTGDHAIVPDVSYEATWRLFSELLPQRYGIEATFVDMSDPDAVAAAVRPNTKLIHTEAIANPTTKVSDIAALAEVAHRNGALLSVDSTFTPPPMLRPLELGADLVIHSLTKYINGHGDAMGGAVIGRSELISQIKEDAMVDVGGVIAPMNAWLIQRGSITLPLRLAHQQASAQRIAEFLEAQPNVVFVAYPGLDSHPQREIALRQFGDSGHGFGAVLSFALDGTPAQHNEFVSKLNVITSAVSLGHDETLIVHVGANGPRVASYPEPFRKYGHLRLAVGLEDADDLIADLDDALKQTFTQ